MHRPRGWHLVAAWVVTALVALVVGVATVRDQHNSTGPVVVTRHVPFRVGDTWHDCKMTVDAVSSKVEIVTCDPEMPE